MKRQRHSTPANRLKMPPPNTAKVLSAPTGEPPVKIALQPTARSRKLGVDRQSRTLADVLLMQAGREARGHGLYIDQTTIEQAAAAVADQYGGQLRSYYTHDHRGAGVGWMANWMEESRSELAIPGYFDGVTVRGDQLVAGRFAFYDSFAAQHEGIVAQILEMAEKTPALIAQSLEVWGYAVYVDTEGNEYRERPEDVELNYDGMPALRVTAVFASAFVADGAATDGLFASLSRRLGAGKESPRDVLIEALRAAIDAWHQEQSDRAAQSTEDSRQSAVGTPRPSAPQHPGTPALQHPFASSRDSSQSPTTETNPHTEMIKEIKARFGADPARLSRALMLYADNDTLTVDAIDAQLQAQDREAELKQLRAKAEQAEALEAQKKELEQKHSELNQRFETLKKSGQPHEVSTGAASEGGPTATFTNPRTGQAYTGTTLKLMQERAAEGKTFAVTQISNLWVPQIWIQGMPEMVVKQSNLLTSEVVYTAPIIDDIANGGGITGNVPFFKEPNFADEIQVEDTAPTVNNVASGKQICPILNRVSAVGATALAGAVSASDPFGFAQGVAARLRLRQRETTLLNILRGAFGNANLGTSAALSSLVEVQADESGASPTAAQLIDTDMIFDAMARLGEAKEALEAGGVIWMHSALESALSKADQIAYVRDSEGRIILRSWKGIRVLINDALRRAGTTDGYVYDTYIFTPRSIAMGDKPQVSYAGEAESVASLVMDIDEAKNNATLYDRTRFVLHPSGLAWGGTPSGQSATNAELATRTNWSLAFGDVKNVGIVNILSNG